MLRTAATAIALLGFDICGLLFRPLLLFKRFDHIFTGYTWWKEV
jgi:hypothetical protein